MGAADFYDRDSIENGGYYDGTAYWDLMASGSWNNSTKSPAHPNPWLKMVLWGWTTPITLSGENRLYTLYPTETHSGQIYKLPTTGGDYYLLENKQQDYINNSSSSRNKGLVIFHAQKNLTPNTSYPNNGHPQRLYVVDPHSATAIPSGNPSSYGVKTANRSFTNPYNPKRFFTSTTTPNNLGWTGNALPAKKDITMIRQETVGGVNVVRFVLNPIISGDTKFCNDEYFEVLNVPSNSDVSWGERNINGAPSLLNKFTITEEDNGKAKYDRVGLAATGGDISFPAGSA